MRAIFEGALAIPATDRDAYLARACAGDSSARRQVEGLLASHARGSGFLETPAVVLFGSALGSRLEGQRLGPYDVQSRIGAGGMGEVYRARDTRLGRTVAIKVLLPSAAAGDPSSRERFEREAKAVAALNHPHICTLYDVGTVAEIDGGPVAVQYLVMEYLDGQTLADRLAAGPLPVADALTYGVQIASALDRAHREGIVHRDLKPRNIMLTSSGAKLLDFGLAKSAAVVETRPVNGSSELTASGAILGTLHYMAPEQLEGGAADARTDVFGFGCVLYEMVSGRKAFHARSSASLLTAIMVSEPPPAGRLRPSIPAQLDAVIARCLRKNPDERWHSAAELHDALTHIAPTAPSSRNVRWRRLAAGALVTALLVMAMWLGWPRGGPPAGATVGAKPPQVAVLPLRLVGDVASADRHLGLGIADAIITRLAIVRQIGLRPTAAVLSYVDAPVEPLRVAEALAVDHVLVGTIQPTATAYRVTVQLVQSPAGSVAWARSYDVVRGSLLTLQDTIAEQVVDALRIELSSVDRARFRRRYTENAEAYDLYVRGRASLVNYTEAEMKTAIEAFERAIAIDGNYALARAGLSIAAAWFSIRYAYETDAYQWGARADREAKAALAADPSLAEATLALASAAGTLHGGFNWPVVIEQATQALSIDPTLDLAHVVLMRAFFHLGLFDNMADEALASRRINPLGNVEIARLEVAASLFAGSYAQARDQALAMLARTDAPVIRNYLGLAQHYAGDTTSARTTLAGVQRGGRPDVRSQAALAGVEAAAGDKAAARARIVAIERGPYMDHHVAASLAAAWAQLGDPQASVTWMERAAASGFACYPWFARDPLLDPVRNDPAVIQLLERLRREHDREAARYAAGR